MKKTVPDLSQVENAREFLDTLVINGKRVQWVELEGGKILYFNELSDLEAVLLAKNIYFNLFVGEPGSQTH